MTSEKDTSNYAERQSSAGGGLSYTFGAGGLSGSAFASRTKIDSNFDAVGQQTGIVAGDGGFNVNVAGHTQLNGAQIVSPAAEDKNTLTTGTFDFSNIDNTFDSSSSTAGVTLSSGPAIGGPQFAQTSEKKNGSTYAAISPGTITVKADDANGTDSTAGLSRDTSNANQTVQNTFNLRETQNDLAFAQAFGKTATYAVGQAADQLERTNPALFGEGGAGRDAMHAAVTAIGAAISGGNIAGAVGGSLTGDALTALVRPIIDQAVSGLPPGSQEAARNALNVVVATAGGAAAGSLAGGSQGALAGGGSASNNEIYNKQSRDDSPSKADGKTKDLVSQVCGAGAQCSDAVLQAAIQAQGANADAASANMQTGAPYVASAAGVALLGPEALMAAALAGGLDYAGSAYSYQTGLSKDKPDFTNSYVAGVIGGAVYPFAIADKVISGMGVAGKIVATGYNAGVAGVGAFGTAGITHQDSPDLSAGVATATTGAAAWAKAVFPSFLGSLANQIIQGAAGPIQNAIQSGTEK